MKLRETFGRVCHDTRIGLDLTQLDLGEGVGVSRGHIAKVEAGRANISLDLLERIADALGTRVDLVASPPTFLSEREPRDVVHARCSGMIGRRLAGAGWQIAREVDISDGRVHGWADILAFDPRTGTLVIIEIKTRLQDLGAVERQVDWYERHGHRAAARLGWSPRRSETWLIVLDSAEVSAAIQAHKDLIDQAFPARADHMLAVIRGTERPMGRGIAMVDPASHRTDWLLRTRLDGRRSRSAYGNYADAARALEPKRRGRA